MALAILLSATACSAAVSTTPSATPKPGPAGLIKPGVLTACIDPEYAPLEYYKNGADGDIIGFDADAARAIANYWKVDIKFEVTTFEGLQPGLAGGRCDLIPGGLYMSAARLAVLDGSAYMKTGPSLIVGKGLKGKITKELDLCGMTISAQSASANATVAQSVGDKCVAAGKANVTVAEYPKTADTVLAVVNGKAQALIETDVAAADIVSKNKGTLVGVKGIFPTDTTFGMFTKHNSALTPSLAKAIAALKDDGTLGTIAKRYNLDPESITTTP